jgi:hypothetical protein
MRMSILVVPKGSPERFSFYYTCEILYNPKSSFNTTCSMLDSEKCLKKMSNLQEELTGDKL